MLFKMITELFAKSVAIRVILPVSLACVLVGCIAGYVFKRKDVFLAATVISCSGMELAIITTNMVKEAIPFCFSTFAMFSGVCYLGLIAGFEVRKKIQARRRNREQILRKLKFTLPEKDNTYIRDRLNTILNVEKTEKSEEKASQMEDGSDSLRLEHVRKLLTKVKDAPLTQGERLEAEEMSKMFSAYLRKSKWSPDDVHMMNELFSCLLKLSAKYSV